MKKESMIRIMDLIRIELEIHYDEGTTTEDFMKILIHMTHQSIIELLKSHGIENEEEQKFVCRNWSDIIEFMWLFIK